LPSLPQVAAALTPHLPLGSSLSAGAGEHVPGEVVNVHETQGPSHNLSQQTPLTEQTRPAMHSLFCPHGVPFGLSPQDPLKHTAPSAQSPSAAQAERHELVPHLKG
jgi:hypothetical protein